MKTIRQEAQQILTVGFSSEHHLRALTVEPVTIGEKRANDLWKAVVSPGGSLEYFGRSGTPLRALENALCFSRIAEQGWG